MRSHAVTVLIDARPEAIRAVLAASRSADV
jgi:hypothetical protein